MIGHGAISGIGIGGDPYRTVSRPSFQPPYIRTKAPLYSQDDYQFALQSLLPRGRVWPRGPEFIQSKLMLGLAGVYARNNIRANQLLIDAFPSTAYELLPEWESTLGLPDPCAGSSPTLQSRRAQVIARFEGKGGQSAQYMIAYAASLGYSISITQYAPARVGQSRVGQPLNGQAWAHAWTINSALNTIVRSRVGSSSVGEPLAYWSNAVLECEMRAVAPAHTILNFAYS